jgi:DNA polymerase-4
MAAMGRWDGCRRILHCDMDCFYAAVHMRDDPSLAGRPVVVGGDPDGRGVVAAASYEARRYGIHSAMAAAQARRLCPDTVFLKPDFARYRAESDAIFAIYRLFTPVVQPLSLDEAYLDVTDRLGELGSATAIAHEIRRRVRDERGLTVSVGVAPSKLVAKIASDHDKPDGLTVVKPSQVEDFLAPLPVRRLHGVGPAGERALAELGVTTVAELRRLSLDRLIERFGHWGRTLYDFARGDDRREVRVERVRRSLSTEHTFVHDIRDRPEIDRVVTGMAEEVATGLEQRSLAACTVTLKARYPDFTTVTRSHTLPVPTADAATIAACARDLVGSTEAVVRSVRLLGVGASNLVPGGVEQLALFGLDDAAGVSPS